MKLDTTTVPNRLRPFLSFEEAREFVRTLGLKNREEWTNYCKSGKKPQDLPYTPDTRCDFVKKNSSWDH